MWENLKVYLLEIGIKKYTPVALAAAFASLGTYLAAHSGMLEQWGVTYGVWPLQWGQGQDPSGPVILIELDTLKTAILVGIPAIIAVFSRAAQHHTTGTSVITQAATSPQEIAK